MAHDCEHSWRTPDKHHEHGCKLNCGHEGAHVCYCGAEQPSDNPVDFTPAQLEWLRQMLTPRCCHVSGDHDPTHFKERRYVCEIQQAERYRALRAALNLGDAKPEEAIEADGGCGWCEYHREKAAKEATA